MTPDTHTLHNAFGTVSVSEYGGQVLSWRTADGRERLYTPDNLMRQSGRALRGGVPVCFPQFSGRGTLPKHGLVRTLPWRLRARTESALILAIGDDDTTRALWPHAFELVQTVVLDAGGLSIALDVGNRGEAPFAFTGALHTYLRVPEVTACAVHGLQGREYEDAADGSAFKRLDGALRVTGEVDRVFADAPSPVRLDYGDGTGLDIAQGGFADTVVWCPGPQLAAAFTDMPADDWQRMLCVEAASAVVPVAVPAGGHWQGWQRLSPV